MPVKKKQKKGRTTGDIGGKKKGKAKGPKRDVLKTMPMDLLVEVRSLLLHLPCTALNPHSPASDDADLLLPPPR
jgi:hypothetical protein